MGGAGFEPATSLAPPANPPRLDHPLELAGQDSNLRSHRSQRRVHFDGPPARWRDQDSNLGLGVMSPAGWPLPYPTSLPTSIRTRGVPVYNRTLWPLSYGRSWTRSDSNRRHPSCKDGAPPAELRAHTCSSPDLNRGLGLEKATSLSTTPLEPDTHGYLLLHVPGSVALRIFVPRDRGTPIRTWVCWM